MIQRSLWCLSCFWGSEAGECGILMCHTCASFWRKPDQNAYPLSCCFFTGIPYPIITKGLQQTPFRLTALALVLQHFFSSGRTESNLFYFWYLDLQVYSFFVGARTWNWSSKFKPGNSHNASAHWKSFSLNSDQEVKCLFSKNAASEHPDQ